MTRTVRPRGARIALGVGLVLAAVGTMAPSASALTPPPPEPPPIADPLPDPTPEAPAVKAPAAIPSPGPAKTLSLSRGDGQRIRVSWPTGHRTVASGSTVRVRVSQPRRGERKLTVSLLRISEKGRILGSAQRSGVTRGTLSVAIPKGEGRRYSLRLALGSKVLRRLTIQVPKAATPAPAAPAPPSGVVTGLPLGNDALRPELPLGNDIAVHCDAGPAEGTLELSATSLLADAGMAFRVLNTGQSCLASIDGLTVERQDDHGDWVRALASYPISAPPLDGFHGIAPGTRGGTTFWLEGDRLPGTYRLNVPIRTIVPPGHQGPFTSQTATLTSETFTVSVAP